MTTDNVEHGSSSSSHDQHLQHTVDDAHRQAARDEDVARLRENLAALHSYVAGMHGDIAALLEQHQKTVGRV